MALFLFLISFYFLDSLMRMLDSFWAYTRGRDNRFPKVIIAATTFIVSFYFIPSSEFNAYLKQIKVILSIVKKYRIFSLVTNTIYTFFTVANRQLRA